MSPKITWDERDGIAKRNRALLDAELLSKSLEFESRPYEAHVQFSNFCNMSCIMCWDGDNPPLEKMSPELLERLATQVAPNLSVITPHEASEPTVVTWEETVSLAKDYSVELALTTNVQEFDEAKFHEVKDVLEVVVMSIDSHVPHVFEKIRLGAKAEKVFRNAETIAPLCRDHGIECIGQAVFMTENAPMMPETVAWLADIGVTFVSVIGMNDTNRRSWHLDAALHFSAEYIDWIKNRCVATAKEKKIRLSWFLSAYEMHDFREEGATGAKESKEWNDRWDTKMRFRHPGYCRFAYDRLRVEVGGNVSPCGLDSHHELELGNLADQDFDEIWNGPTARDLRRAHYSWDYPSLCKTCRYADRIEPREALPFVHDALASRWAARGRKLASDFALGGPDHMTRQVKEPVIRLATDEELDSYVLMLSLGGELEEIYQIDFKSPKHENGFVELPVSREVWARLRSNVGYWWYAVGVRAGEPVVGSPEVRCLIRHEPLARIEGSRLKYPDEGHFAPIYLGGEREVGWTERGKLPSRPALSGVGGANGAAAGRRFAKLRKAPAVDAKSVKLTPAGYHELVEQIRAVVNSALGPDASLVVVSKGDAELLYFDGRPAWHFPCDEIRDYAGFYPADSNWATGHLERQRDEGAEYLLLPVTAYWWLDHYPGFAEHLRKRYPAIVEDVERCTIFDLREPLEIKRGAVEQAGAAA
jgi:radical SAM protein with 4Fe4S-binding SPASM domain